MPLSTTERPIDVYFPRCHTTFDSACVVCKLTFLFSPVFSSRCWHNYINNFVYILNQTNLYLVGCTIGCAGLWWLCLLRKKGKHKLQNRKNPFSYLVVATAAFGSTCFSVSSFLFGDCKTGWLFDAREFVFLVLSPHAGGTRKLHIFGSKLMWHSAVALLLLWWQWCVCACRSVCYDRFAKNGTFGWQTGRC